MRWDDDGATGKNIPGKGNCILDGTVWEPKQSQNDFRGRMA
jgi:hypothetical protein